MMKSDRSIENVMENLTEKHEIIGCVLSFLPFRNVNKQMFEISKCQFSNFPCSDMD